jgi:hypothetical protein
MVETHFYFRDPETYHFFRWVLVAKEPDSLVAKAMKDCEHTDRFEDEDVCLSARDALIDTLQNMLDDLKSAWTVTDADEIGEVTEDVESVLKPILNLALERICLQNVAEALLRRAGKWAPSRELPEIL